jgi:hypothetical protein
LALRDISGHLFHPPPPKKKEIIEKKRNRIRKIRDERRIRKKGKNKNGSFSFILPGGDG